MQVLHINCNYITTALHQNMVEHLDTCNVNSTVFVPTYNKNNSILKANTNVIISECFHKWDRLLFDYKQKKIYSSLTSNLNVHNFDCIHAYTLFTDGNVACNLKAAYGIPYVVAVRNTDVNYFFKYRINLRKRGIRILKEASAIFFLSPVYKETVFKRYISKKLREGLAHKTYIIPNGIDDFWFKEKNRRKSIEIKRDYVNLVYAGCIDANKNIGTTLKALKLLKQHGIQVSFTVVGNVKDKRIFEKVQRNNWTSYIPARPKEELIKVYRAHDIFVMPSLTESFGLVYAEAMSQGLPVIYSKGQGFDGQFIDGTVGFAVNSRSPKSVANAIEKAMKQYQTLHKNCLDYVDKFEWNKIVGMYAAIYRDIVSES